MQEVGDFRRQPTRNGRSRRGAAREFEGDRDSCGANGVVLRRPVHRVDDGDCRAGETGDRDDGAVATALAKHRDRAVQAERKERGREEPARLDSVGVRVVLPLRRGGDREDGDRGRDGRGTERGDVQGVGGVRGQAARDALLVHEDRRIAKDDGDDDEPERIVLGG